MKKLRYSICAYLFMLLLLLQLINADLYSGGTVRIYISILFFSFFKIVLVNIAKRQKLSVFYSYFFIKKKKENIIMYVDKFYAPFSFFSE